MTDPLTGYKTDHRPSTILLLVGLGVLIIGAIVAGVARSHLGAALTLAGMEGADTTDLSGPVAKAMAQQTFGLVTLAVGGTVALGAVFIKVARA